MHDRFSKWALALVPALLVTGCATTGGGYSDRDQMANTVYATHRMVRNLEQNLGDSVSKLNETATALEMRVGQTEQNSLELQAMVEENQIKLDRLQSKLDEFTAAVYRAINVTPPSSSSSGSDSRMNVPMDEIQISEPNSPSGSAATTQPPNSPPQPEEQAMTNESATTSVIEGGDAMTDYQNAQKLFVDKDYQAALQAYDAYLQRYPNNNYSANAMFWKAQCLLKLERDQDAIAEYADLRQKYPSSDKVPPSYYYEALAYVRLGQSQRAVAALEAVIRQWPATAAATQAEELLAKLQQ